MSDLTSFYIDPDTDDLAFDARGRLQTVSDDVSRRQRIRLRLGTHVREWFLDTLLGVPWMELVEKGTPKTRIRAEVSKALMADDEVERIESLTIGDLGPDRTLPIHFVVRLRDGSQLSDRAEVIM